VTPSRLSMMAWRCDGGMVTHYKKGRPRRSAKEKCQGEDVPCSLLTLPMPLDKRQRPGACLKEDGAVAVAIELRAENCQHCHRTKACAYLCRRTLAHYCLCVPGGIMTRVSPRWLPRWLQGRKPVTLPMPLDKRQRPGALHWDRPGMTQPQHATTASKRELVERLDHRFNHITPSRPSVVALAGAGRKVGARSQQNPVQLWKGSA